MGSFYTRIGGLVADGLRHTLSFPEVDFSLAVCGIALTAQLDISAWMIGVLSVLLFKCRTVLYRPSIQLAD
jgi:hypothetical protein